MLPLIPCEDPPLDNEILPPLLALDCVVVPAVNEMLLPSPLLLFPTDTTIEPPLPLVASPVPNDRDPLDPPLDASDPIVTAPLLGDALLVTYTAPLTAETPEPLLAPLDNVIAPPA
jgi:hypothetical protein